MCRSHYVRWWRYGDPTAGRFQIGKPGAWIDELLAAEPTDECVEWPFGARAGYGVIQIHKRSLLVTHVVLERVGLPRPQIEGYHGACALHSCDNPPCCNPRHLRWGTNAENVRDREQRRWAA